MDEQMNRWVNELDGFMSRWVCGQMGERWRDDQWMDKQVDRRTGKQTNVWGRFQIC